jgi:hypothetical protein
MTMTQKFINKQQHSYTCGPVAVLNALKWLGYGKTTSYRETLLWFYQFGLCSEIGMKPKQLSKSLKALKIPYKRKSYASIQDIEKALDDGKTVVANYMWYYRGRCGKHYVFIDRHTDKSFRAWNYTSTGTAPWLTKKKLAQWFRCNKRFLNKQEPEERKPVIWVIDSG